MLWDQSAGLFRPAAAFGFNFEIMKKMGLRAGESVTGKVYDEGNARLLCTTEDVAEAMADMRPFNRDVFARSLQSDLLPRCVLATPISTGEKKYGVLVLETLNGSTAFTKSDLPFIQSLADLIALAIDRYYLEEQLVTVRDTHQGEHMRFEVMAALSHELRMPLSTIKGYATALLLDEIKWSKKKREEFLCLIEEACNEMEGMIKDILDSALIEVEQLTFEYQPVRMQQIAREVATEVERRSGIHRPVVDFPSDFPVIKADARWIKQVLRNILDNAVKYSPNGGLIVIKGEARTIDVVVSVADQGIGISSEDLIPLFEKYSRVRSVSTLHVSGTGLGLPIARAIVEAHGGRIWVESKVGEGTTIFFSLPRNQSERRRQRM
jgi:K+-sensing histidine kinase KdpD